MCKANEPTSFRLYVILHEKHVEFMRIPKQKPLYFSVEAKG